MDLDKTIWKQIMGETHHSDISNCSNSYIIDVLQKNIYRNLPSEIMNLDKDLRNKSVIFCKKLDENRIKIDSIFIKKEGTDRVKRLNKLFVKLDTEIVRSYQELVIVVKNKRFIILFVFERSKKIKNVAHIYKIDKLDIYKEKDIKYIDKTLQSTIEINDLKKDLKKIYNKINRSSLKPNEILDFLKSKNYKNEKKNKALIRIYDKVSIFFKYNKPKIVDFDFQNIYSFNTKLTLVSKQGDTKYHYRIDDDLDYNNYKLSIFKYDKIKKDYIEIDSKQHSIEKKIPH